MLLHCHKILRIVVFIGKSTQCKNYFLGTSNHWILHLPSMRIFQQNFRVFDHTDCMICVSKVEKTSSSAYCGIGVFDCRHLQH